MKRFHVTVRAPDGTLRLDELEASSRFEVAHRLRREGVTVVRVAEAESTTVRRLSRRALVVFTRQCSVMLAAGLPLTEVLHRMAQQPARPAIGVTAQRLQRAVESGASLSHAMATQGRVFPPMYVAMVGAGEHSGALVAVMERLAQWLEQRDVVQRRVIGALLYPAVVVVTAIAAVTVLLWTVVPTFEAMLSDAGVALPAATRVVVHVSGLVREYGTVAAAALMAAALMVAVDMRSDAGQQRRDRVLFAVPVAGGLWRQASVARSARTLAMLLTAGVGVLSALELTARTAGAGVIAAALRDVQRRVAAGDGLADAFAASGAFPAMTVSMLAVGERTGALADMLERLSAYYEQTVEAATRDLLALMEPLLMLAVGAVIAGVVIAMYLPVFEMISAV